MKERPIIFSSGMVKAILEDRKTMTRRIVKPQPAVTENGSPRWDAAPGKKYIPNGPRSAGGGRAVTMTDLIGRYCPYGIPGSRLYCKEGGWICDDRFFAYDARPTLCKTAEGEFIEAAPGAPEKAPTPERLKELGWTRRSSMFMPRWASRILLEVCEVRVERLQEISNSDAAREGIDIPPLYADEGLPSVNANRFRFHALWNSIHGKDGWKANPWVWVIGFRMLEGPK